MAVVLEQPIVRGGPPWWNRRRACVRCGAVLLLTEFPMQNGRQRSIRCRRCMNAHRRARDARNGYRAIPIPEDPNPAVRLRLVLQARRQAGLPWDDDVFDALVGEIIRAVPKRRIDHDGWAGILREQQPIWRDAFERRNGVITPLTPELVFGD